MNFSIFLHFPFLSLYIEFDNKYIIFSSVFLFYKNDRDFTPCRHVAYAYIISSFTISLAHALTLFIVKFSLEIRPIRTNFRRTDKVVVG